MGKGRQPRTSPQALPTSGAREEQRRAVRNSPGGRRETWGGCCHGNQGKHGFQEGGSGPFIERP